MNPTKSAYTLPEVLFTVTAIALTAVGLLVSLANLNEMAMRNRLKTLATAVVEDQIDRALREGPFTPTSSTPSIPPALVSSSTTVTIYDDPAYSGTTGNVTGALTVNVTGTTAPVNSGSASATVPIYQIQTSLTYTFHNKPFTVQMSALRSIDE